MTLTISPGAIKPGDKVFITTASGGAVSSIGMAIGTTPPPCATTNAP